MIVRRSALVLSLFVAACSTRGTASSPESGALLRARATTLALSRTDAAFAAIGHGAALVRNAHGFELPPQDGGWHALTPLHVDLPADARGATHLSVADDPSTWIELRGEVDHAAPALAVQDALVFESAAEGLDVVQTARAGAMEEIRVLRGPRAATTARWRMRVGSGVGALRLREGRVEVVDVRGNVRLVSSPMFAVDARGVRRDVGARLESTPSGEDAYVLTATLDTTGLQFPIALDPVWTAAGTPNHPSASDALLDDGTVVAAGGYASAPSNKCERYDPATNAWTACGNLGTPRYAHAAAKAPGGALVVGGYDGVKDIGGAERFSTTTKAWTPSGTMTTPRNGAVAIELASGNVLVVGGTGAGTPLLSAELWNASSNSFSSAGSTSVAHTGHVAALLPSGRVFVFGGSTAVDIYDPSSGWSTGTPATAARTNPFVVVLGTGDVLVGGGGVDTALLYHPGTNTWSSVGSMTKDPSRGAAGSALLSNGMALVVGGSVQTCGGTPPVCFVSFSASTQVFDPKTNAWAAADDAPQGGGPMMFRLASGKVLADWTTASSLFAPWANGTACTASWQCLTGNCVDGYCCDTACNGQCEACDGTTKGTCSPVSGAVHGSRSACSSGGGDACKAQSCNGVDRTACHFAPATTACGAATCTSGVETHVSTCNGSGSCSDVPKSCGTYVCGATACKTSCTADTDCTAGHYCKANVCETPEALGKPCTTPTACGAGLFCTDGFCCGSALCAPGSSCGVPGKEGSCTKVQGSLCAADSECGTGHCVDGVCCDTACEGPCESCDVPDPTSGRSGKCVPVKGKPHGMRTCPTDATNVCASATCDGTDTTKCAAYPGSEVTCRFPSCADGMVTAKATCDGAGHCPDAMTSGCDGLTCTPDGKGCKTSCTNDDDCLSGWVCDGSTSKCKKLTATCSADGASSIGDDGTAKDCAPYRCTKAGTCGSSCGTTDDCSGGTICDPTSSTCVTPAAADTGSSGGCSLVGARETSQPGALAAVIAALLASVVSRRRR